MKAKEILWFKDIHYEDIAQVGGKGANLGEMYNIGIPVPNGFVVTSEAYYRFIEENKLKQKLKDILKPTDLDQPDQLLDASKKIKKTIKQGIMSQETATAIMMAYKKLSDQGETKNIAVAVRSSATAEDLPDASFAGQQETFLNVVGEANVVERVKDCWASLFTPRAIFYREKKHFDHFTAAVAVPVQKLINSDVSGVMFTINPVSNDKKQVMIETVWGLGEYIVQGTVTPDQHIVDKTNWKLLSYHNNPQEVELVRSSEHETKEIKVPTSRKNKPKISDKTAIALAKIGQKLQSHYNKPQDIEFAIYKDKIFIVQARPITTVATNQKTLESQNSITKPADLKGEQASPGMVAGKVVIIKNPNQIDRIKQGDILVTTMTTPDFVPAMKKAAGIITDKGGQTSHAAIVSRELGVPCVVGTKTATKVLKEGTFVTLNGATGEVWFGDLTKDMIHLEHEAGTHKKINTATKVYVNLGEPELAEKISQKHVDGVGLLRAEFMIANIGVHPKRMISEGRQQEYIDKLADGLLKFCKSFSPRPVIYRATDFKTNEYRFLKWGKLYEPEEPNPMLGFRGAIRYINSPDVFMMELEAIKQVRNKHGFKNLWLMIPFCRTPQELIEVKKIIAAAGLLRTPSFRLLMMVEIPSNIILLDDFIDVGIDGISIGSNDLTMLTLGLDRDNGEVAKAFDEMNPAVLQSLKKAITTAKKRGITSGICGQAPSNHPDLVEMLVKWGVTSISVSPDVIDSTREVVAWAEKRRLESSEKKKEK